MMLLIYFDHKSDNMTASPLTLDPHDIILAPYPPGLFILQRIQTSSWVSDVKEQRAMEGMREEGG